jgi:hypothetical protein
VITNRKTGPVLKAVLEWEGLRRAPFGLSSRPREWKVRRTNGYIDPTASPVSPSGHQSFPCGPCHCPVRDLPPLSARYVPVPFCPISVQHAVFLLGRQLASHSDGYCAAKSGTFLCWDKRRLDNVNLGWVNSLLKSVVTT